MTIKNKIKMICVMCDFFSSMALLVSLVYTLKFFVTGASDLNIILMVMLSLVFESVKILVVMSSEKSRVKTIIMCIFIIISITFTMNDFLNNIEMEKQNSKQVNPEFEKNQKMVTKYENDININEKKLDELNKQKNEEIANLTSGMELTKTSTINKISKQKKEIADNYNNRIEKIEDEINVKNKKLDEMINVKIEKYIFKDGSTKNINTKVLDFVFGESMEQETKNLLISLFIAILIDLTHVALNYIKVKERVKLKVIEEQEVEEKEAKKKEAKKEVIIKSITPVPEIKEEKNSNKKVINLAKKSVAVVPTKLSKEANVILEKTIDNDGIVPPYRKLVEEMEVSYSVIQRRVKELIENNIVKKIEGKRTLQLVNVDKIEETN